MSKFCCTFAVAKVKHNKTMVQTQPTFQSVLNMVYMLPYSEQKQLLTKVSYNLALNDPEPLIDSEWRSKPTYSVDEVLGKVYKHLGGLYGLNDIREAK